jgi:hypothetical protein
MRRSTRKLKPGKSLVVVRVRDGLVTSDSAIEKQPYGFVAWTSVGPRYN